MHLEPLPPSRTSCLRPSRLGLASYVAVLGGLFFFTG